LKKRAEAEDKSPAASKPSTPKAVSRSRSRVPVTEREDGTYEDPGTDLLQTPRGGNLNTFNLGSRPLVLRLVDPKYPQAVINPEGTWVQVSQPPGRTTREPATIPVAISGAPVVSSDPYDFPDSVWRDPSLFASNTTLVSSTRTQVFPITDPPEEAPEPEDRHEEVSKPPVGPRPAVPRALAAAATASTRSSYQVSTLQTC
jgi:hypothetical protein